MNWLIMARLVNRAVSAWSQQFALARLVLRFAKYTSSVKRLVWMEHDFLYAGNGGRLVD